MLEESVHFHQRNRTDFEVFCYFENIDTYTKIWIFLRLPIHSLFALLQTLWYKFSQLRLQALLRASRRWTSRRDHHDRHFYLIDYNQFYDLLIKDHQLFVMMIKLITWLSVDNPSHSSARHQIQRYPEWRFHGMVDIFKYNLYLGSLSLWYKIPPGLSRKWGSSVRANRSARSSSSQTWLQIHKYVHCLPQENFHKITIANQLTSMPLWSQVQLPKLWSPWGPCTVAPIHHWSPYLIYQIYLVVVLDISTIFGHRSWCIKYDYDDNSDDD